LRILRVHNYYQQPGGEDQSYAAECALLEKLGHHVVRYTVHNDSIRRQGRLELAARTLWNPETRRRLEAIARAERVEVAHFDNTFPLVSPSGYAAARAAGAGVVQSLRNYRLLCANALFFRSGRVCEDCLGYVPWRSVVHGCYRNDRMASGVVTALVAAHRVLGTWARGVDRYVALTEWSRQKFVAGGLPPDRIRVKPNFVDPDPGPGAHEGGHGLFVGRVSQEKGVEVLLAAWRQLGTQPALRIVGDGPLLPLVRAAGIPGVTCLGPLAPEAVLREMRQASFLVFPSLWYEAMPRVLLEAFATGLPVLVSDQGSARTLVEHGVNGLVFETGRADALVEAIQTIAPAEIRAKLGSGAREHYLNRYTAECNADRLLAIYEEAISAARARRRPRGAGPAR
jgi:glycosyltransferase involved in cell wall biosynthesis